MSKHKKWQYVIIVFIFLVAVVLMAGKFDVVKIRKTQIGGPATVEICYFKDASSPFGISGEYNMTLRVTGDKLEGELNFLPADKDIKVGTFKGQVVEVYEDSIEREGALWWETYSEGQEILEELRIIFSEDVASIGLGLMQRRADGAYVYKNPESVVFTLALQAVPCVLK